MVGSASVLWFCGSVSCLGGFWVWGFGLGEARHTTGSALKLTQVESRFEYSKEVEDQNWHAIDGAGDCHMEPMPTKASGGRRTAKANMTPKERQDPATFKVKGPDQYKPGTRIFGGFASLGPKSKWPGGLMWAKSYGLIPPGK